MKWPVTGYGQPVSQGKGGANREPVTVEVTGLADPPSRLPIVQVC